MVLNEQILQPEVQSFIRNYDGDLSALAFQGSPFERITVQELMQQIEGFRRTEKKLPLWHQTQGIYFPPKLNLEQTSSEITAAYKASLVSGAYMADITGGLGVDSYFFAQQVEQVDYFEQNHELSNIAKHNFKALGASSISVHAMDGIDGIRDKHYDFIYLDPARRSSSQEKVFKLSHCEPNVVATLDYLMSRCEVLLIKTSPMLDLSVGLKELQHVAEIHVVAVENEVKEVLWFLRKAPQENPTVRTINFGKREPQTFDFQFGRAALPSHAPPKKFLYEPNAAIMKAGGFTYISEAFGLDKLHINSHLFTSEDLKPFPGRMFRIKEVLPYSKSIIKEKIATIKANVSTRNFPISVKAIRKKWQITDGGDTYLFFTTNVSNEKIVLITEKPSKNI